MTTKPSNTKYRKLDIQNKDKNFTGFCLLYQLTFFYSNKVNIQWVQNFMFYMFYEKNMRPYQYQKVYSRKIAAM